MIKFLFLIGTVYVLTQSNLPLKLFDKISGEESSIYNEKKDVSRYESKNHFGDTMLYLDNLPFREQLDIWQRSSLKIEAREYFPDFNDLADFINERVIGEPIRGEIIKRIGIVEDAYISGSIDTEKAKKDILF